MGVLQGLGDLDGDVDGLARVEVALLVEQPPQRRAPDQFHDDGLDLALAARVVDGHDVGVRQPGGGDGFPPEPGDEGLVGRQVREQDLHRHRASEHLVDRLPDLGHPPSGQAGDQSVARPDHGAGGDGAGGGGGRGKIGHVTCHRTGPTTAETFIAGASGRSVSGRPGR